MYSIFFIRWRNYSLSFNCRHLWYAAFQQLLLVVFSLLPVELQELSYSVKGYLFERREAVWCRPEGHRLQL